MAWSWVTGLASHREGVFMESYRCLTEKDLRLAGSRWLARAHVAELDCHLRAVGGAPQSGCPATAFSRPFNSQEGRLLPRRGILG